MSGWWRGTRLVIGRELLVGFGRTSYRITLAILALGGLAVAVLPRVLASDSKPSYTVAGVGTRRVVSTARSRRSPRLWRSRS